MDYLDPDQSVFDLDKETVEAERTRLRQSLTEAGSRVDTVRVLLELIRLEAAWLGHAETWRKRLLFVASSPSAEEIEMISAAIRGLMNDLCGEEVSCLLTWFLGVIDDLHFDDSWRAKVLIDAARYAQVEDDDELFDELVRRAEASPLLEFYFRVGHATSGSLKRAFVLQQTLDPTETVELDRARLRLATMLLFHHEGDGAELLHTLLARDAFAGAADPSALDLQTAHYRLAGYHRQRGEREAEASTLERCLELATAPSTNNASEMHLLLADALGEFDEARAESHYRAALAESAVGADGADASASTGSVYITARPQSQARRRLAEILVKRGERVAATTLVEQALAEDRLADDFPEELADVEALAALRRAADRADDAEALEAEALERAIVHCRREYTSADFDRVRAYFIGPGQRWSDQVSYVEGGGIIDRRMIRDWSYGQVSESVASLGDGTPHPEGIASCRIFGPVEDFTCACGKYRGFRVFRIVCERCQVEVVPSALRRQRLAHIELASPVVHPRWKRLVALLLDMNKDTFTGVMQYRYPIVVDSSYGDHRYEAGEVISRVEIEQLAELPGRPRVDSGPPALERLLVELHGVLEYKLRAELDDALRGREENQKTAKLQHRLELARAFEDSAVRAHSMVSSVIPVIPADRSELVGGPIPEARADAVDEAYGELIDRNEALAAQLAEVPEETAFMHEGVIAAANALQEAAEVLFDRVRKLLR